MRTAALVITAYVVTFVGLTVAYGITAETPLAVPQGDTCSQYVTIPNPCDPDSFN